MSFDGEEYESNRIIRQLLDIEEHCVDGSAVKQGCSCIQDRHLQALASAAEQYAVISKKDSNKAFGRKVAEYADTRLKSVYAFHAKQPSEKESEDFYAKMADEVRSIRLAFEGNSQFPNFLHSVACGCKNCPPCNVEIAH
jgi:hypothetical protein